MNRFNGISKDNYKTLREHIKNNPERKQKINNILKKEIDHQEVDA